MISWRYGYANGQWLQVDGQMSGFQLTIRTCRVFVFQCCSFVFLSPSHKNCCTIGWDDELRVSRQLRPGDAQLICSLKWRLKPWMLEQAGDASMLWCDVFSLLFHQICLRNLLFWTTGCKTWIDTIQKLSLSSCCILIKFARYVLSVGQTAPEIAERRGEDDGCWIAAINACLWFIYEQCLGPGLGHSKCCCNFTLIWEDQPSYGGILKSHPR